MEEGFFYTWRLGTRKNKRLWRFFLFFPSPLGDEYIGIKLV
nr:MAG TPA: hypothetical protein [Caudoviricetes sp.]